jgi:CsoR family transcriptional regulator, copper-sensing transcriptional repressor
MNENHIERDELLNRLKKIEGQVKGIQRMVEEEKCCTDVMIQISAIRSAINKVGGMMIEKYITECMQQGIKTSIEKGEIDESVNAVIETIVKYIK